MELLMPDNDWTRWLSNFGLRWAEGTAPFQESSWEN